MSTSSEVVDAATTESRADATTRRLRGQVAEQRISASAIARALGVHQTYISRRLIGRVDFTIAELDHICVVTGLDFNWIVTGVGTPKPPAGPKGPGGLLCAIRDLNPEPAD